MGLLSRLFGGGSERPPEPETYKGFAITPTPMKEGSQYRLAARIEKEVAGEVKVHRLIRADTLGDAEAAAEAAVAKARQVIDEQGERIFG